MTKILILLSLLGFSEATLAWEYGSCQKAFTAAQKDWPAYDKNLTFSPSTKKALVTIKEKESMGCLSEKRADRDLPRSCLKTHPKYFESHKNHKPHNRNVILGDFIGAAQGPGEAENDRDHFVSEFKLDQTSDPKAIAIKVYYERRPDESPSAVPTSIQELRNEGWLSLDFQWIGNQCFPKELKYTSYKDKTEDVIASQDKCSADHIPGDLKSVCTQFGFDQKPTAQDKTKSNANKTGF